MVVVRRSGHWHAEWMKLAIHGEIVTGEIGLLHRMGGGRSVGGRRTTRQGDGLRDSLRVVGIRERRVHIGCRHGHARASVQTLGSPPEDWREATGRGRHFKGSVHGAIEVMVGSMVGNHEKARSLTVFVGRGGLIRMANVVWVVVSVAIVVGRAKEALCERVVELGLEHGGQLWSGEDCLAVVDGIEAGC